MGGPSEHSSAALRNLSTEGGGGAEAHEREERRHDEQDDECPRHEHVVGTRPEPPGDGGGVPGEDEHPEQDRPLERAPHRRHVVDVVVHDKDARPTGSALNDKRIWLGGRLGRKAAVRGHDYLLKLALQGFV